MGEQAGGSSADEETRIAASSQPLRRSKRDSATRRKPASPWNASTEGYTPAEASPAAPRRSQRHGAPSSPAVVSVAPSAAKATPTLTAVRGPIVESMALSAMDAPLSQSKRRPVSRPDLRAPSGSSSTAHANSTVTVMGDASVTVRTQLRKVLGRYTARECSLMCESILEHLKRQSNLATALESETSPAHIDWREIAAYIEMTHRMIISPRDCQDLWKFLAYAQTPDEAERMGDELLASSDDEQYDWTVEEIQKRHVNAMKKAAAPAEAPPAGSASAPAMSDDVPLEEAAARVEAPAEEATTAQTTEPSGGTEVIVSTIPTETIKIEQETPSISTEEKATSAAEDTTTVPVPSTVRLHPTYELPTGAPSGWEHAFQPKVSLPLTFVAEKFLKRKPMPAQVLQTSLAPAPAASLALAAAPSPSVTHENPTPAKVNPAPATAQTSAPVSAPMALVEPATPAIPIANNEPALKKQRQEVVAPASLEAA